jgi:hypothetical protein
VHSAGSRWRLERAQIPTVETWDLAPSPIDMLAYSVVRFGHDHLRLRETEPRRAMLTAGPWSCVALALVAVLRGPSTGTPASRRSASMKAMQAALVTRSGNRRSTGIAPSRVAQ